MPHLTSEALISDQDGLAFLRDVLRSEARQPARAALRVVASREARAGTRALREAGGRPARKAV